MLQYININEEPRMELQNKTGKECAVELCNIHGLWEGKNDK
jgi:desulfoferrodoxin (superoxide reductase-like protein)